MNTDNTKTPGDEESDPEQPPGVEPTHEAEGLDEDERQRLGRASMDRWMLHKTFLEDLEAELEAKDAPNRQPPTPDPGDGSDRSLP